jgi:hypothetical protein
MRGPLLGAALLLAAAPARAQLEEAPRDVQLSEQDVAAQQAALADMERKLKSDPEAADALAARLERSRLAERISAAPDAAQRRAEIRAFIDQDAKTAAGLALGFAADDANGTQDFENSVTAKVKKRLVLNPDAKKGLYGRLRQSAKDSGLMKKQAEAMHEEEQQEIIKSMFEGKGGQSAKIITQQLDDKTKEASGPSAVGAGGGLSSSYYDRLGAANLRGYSPQLQSMQSALNARRAPGAPKLIETGKLDYETLSYPAFGMRFDIEGLEKRLRYERNFALAKLLGLQDRYKGERLLDPAVEAELEAKAAGRALPEAFQRRLAALDKARAALAQFSAAAQAAKDPEKITRQLLVALGSLQKESARWITIASLEEEVQRLDYEKDFLSPELIQTIQACPAAEAERGSYLRRGEEYRRSVRALRSADEAAIAALQGADWQSRVDEVEGSLAEAGRLRRNLLRNIDDYRMTAFRLHASIDRRPGWRRTLDGYWERFLPSSGHAKALRLERRGRELLKDVFVKIAQGQLDAAHTVLESYEPARGPAR